jgi:OmpA-OmpF porin, OOP family
MNTSPNQKLSFFLVLIAALLISPFVFGQGKSSSKHINLGPNINSSFDEQYPVLSPDGKTLYFTRFSHPENIGGKKNKGDIWYSERGENNEWSKAVNIGAPLNNMHKNLVVAISADGNTLYLQHHYQKDGRQPVTHGVSVSKRKSDGTWGFPEKLPIDYFLNKSEDLGMSISKDGRVMILSIESYGTLGAEDLYVSFKGKNGQWSDPKTLGSTINSPYQELTPFLADDLKTLYFSSNGRGGFGSKDIFMSQRLDDTWTNWSKPVNLGSKVNTEGMELSFFIPSGSDYAYLVSTQNSDGYGDINKVSIKEVDMPIPSSEPGLIEIPEPVSLYSENQPQSKKEEEIIEISEIKAQNEVVIEGMIVNKKTGNPISGKIQFRAGKEGQYEVIDIDEKGEFQSTLIPGQKYEIKITATGFMSLEEFFLAENFGTYNKTYSLVPLEIGTTVNLQSVLFQQGTAVLLEDSFEELDKVVEMMLENPGMEIELGGHTDNRGNSKLNIQLSQERVDKVKEYLVEKGIQDNRIKGKGYGGTKPIASNNSEETRKLNRRVEFTITKK